MNKLDDLFFKLWSDFGEAVDDALETGKMLRETKKGKEVEDTLFGGPTL